MATLTPSTRRTAALVAVALGLGGLHAVGLRAGTASVSAADAVRAAVVSKLGPGVDVSVQTIGLKGDSPVFREARPDPSARLGQPIRFTLVTSTGAAMAVTATIRVVGRRAVARRDIDRGEVLAAVDVESVEGAIVDVPLRRLPTADEVVGARVIRPLPTGATVLTPFITLRRVVRQGDPVTVVAAAGAVEVTAAMVAADGGQVGDVIRVVNPDTRQYLRARIVKEGMVEVIDGR